MKKEKKKYLIALEETRSRIALVCGVLILFCSVGAIFAMIWRLSKTNDLVFQYFTVLSNLLSAAGAAFMIPFAVEGIRKKRFVLPRWIVRFQYACTTSLAVTMIAFLALILPTQGLKQLDFESFWLHIVTPPATIILFRCVETGIAFTRRDMLLSLLPLCAYAALYYVMVVLIGEKNGGWPDFYMTFAFWPMWVSFLIIFGMALASAALLRLAQKRRAAQNRAKIARAWSEDLEPTQLLIEAFGLGRYIGSHGAEEELTVPLDIFAMMSKQYHIPLEKLTKAYVKGALDALNERRG